MRVAVNVIVAPGTGGRSLESVLSDKERARLDALVSASARRRYVTAHALLRFVVADRSGVAPRRVAVRQRCETCGGLDHGRPEVEGLYVSLATAESLVVVATSEQVPLGVDVEPARAARFSGFDEVALSPAEVAALAALPADERAAARVRWWTRKEALLKATGTGLRTDPRLLPVQLPDPRVRDVDVHPGYVCSVAVLSGSVGVVTISEPAAGWAALAS